MRRDVNTSFKKNESSLFAIGKNGDSYITTGEKWYVNAWFKYIFVDD